MLLSSKCTSSRFFSRVTEVPLRSHFIVSEALQRQKLDEAVAVRVALSHCRGAVIGTVCSGDMKKQGAIRAGQKYLGTTARRF